MGSFRISQTHFSPSTREGWRLRQRRTATFSSSPTADANEDHESRIVSDLTNGRVETVSSSALPSLGFPSDDASGAARNPDRPLLAYSRLCRCGRSCPAKGARVLVKHLITVHGHQSRSRGSQAANASADPREQGWGDAFQSHGLPPGSRSCERTSAIAEDMRQPDTAAELADPATRRLASADQLGIGALKAIRRAGFRAPEDVTAVSYDGATESEYCYWPTASPWLGNRSRQWPRPQSQPFSNPAQVPLFSNSQPSSSLRQSCGCAAP